MTDVVSANLQQNPTGAWCLWVATGEDYFTSPHTFLDATAAGRLPTLANRTRALARLGYRETAPDSPTLGWQWVEEYLKHDGGVQLVGRVAVLPVGVAA